MSGNDRRTALLGRIEKIRKQVYEVQFPPAQPVKAVSLVRVCGDVAEYRVMINHAHALTELSVQIEPVPGCADSLALASRLERAFQDAFTLRVPVKPVPPGTLPRFEMKAKRWLNQS